VTFVNGFFSFFADGHFSQIIFCKIVQAADCQAVKNVV
jgi:hypothetical protein